ncbi:hypothetical protein AB7D55_004161 [Vibrio mimicus]
MKKKTIIILSLSLFGCQSSKISGVDSMMSEDVQQHVIRSLKSNSQKMLGCNSIEHFEVVESKTYKNKVLDTWNTSGCGLKRTYNIDVEYRNDASFLIHYSVPLDN